MRCPEYRIGKKKLWGVVVCFIERKVQQSSTWVKTLKDIVIEVVSQRDVKRTFKILREVWLNIGIEKMDTQGGVIVKALLDSRATGIFIGKKTAEKHSFKLQELERLLIVRNIDRTRNSRENIIY